LARALLHERLRVVIPITIPPKRRRWAVFCGAIVGVAITAIQVSLGNSILLSLTEGVGAAFVTMIVLVFGAQIWRGDDLSGANIGNTGVEFRKAIAEPIETVNRRVEEQVGGIEERVFALEEHQAEADSEARIEEPTPGTDKEE
jgi:hypothetical protein